MKRLFISRELASDGFLMKQLLAHDFEVKACSLLEFKAIPFLVVPPCDWIFFYSKNAVAFFLDQQDSLDSNVKLAAFGPGTARALHQRNQATDFVGNGKVEDTASRFTEVALHQTVLFPRALHSLQSIQRRMPATVESIDLIVYSNTIRPNFDLPETDFLVLTSPMNARAYFARYTPTPQQKILAIGPSTAKALLELGIEKVAIAPSPSEASIWDLLQELIQ
ncbi:MAG: uroporphyrinogen-III synthase [Bacteroidota bacterium]